MKKNPKNFNKDFPLWKACGLKDNIRTGMHYISFANGYAYATDSHILVKARLTDISDFDEMDLARWMASSFMAAISRRFSNQRELST